MNQPTNPAGAADVHDSVVIERTFDAPIDLVWQMWTDGTEFAKWYGPPGATIPVADIDARVGGRRRVCMEVTTPDGPMRMWFGGEHRAAIGDRAHGHDHLQGGASNFMSHRDACDREAAPPFWMMDRAVDLPG